MPGSVVRRVRGKREGFTLIEVLVAMVILAIGLLALEAMTIGAARMVIRADRQSELTAIASAELESSLAAFRAVQPVQNGTVTHPRAIVTRTVAPFGPVAIAGGGTLSGITVTVQATAATGTSGVTLQPVTVVGRATR